MTEEQPETIEDVIGRHDDWDPLAGSSPSHLHWTITNLGEAVPGVITPLCWAVWGRPADYAARRVAYDIGVLTRREMSSTDPDEDVVRIFYGRVAMKLEYMARMGDRVPGTTGEQAIVSMFGEAPEGMTFNPTKARYPSIALRFPVAFARFPRRLRATVVDQDRWWRESVERVPALDLAAAIGLYAEAVERFETSMIVQVTGILSSVRPLFDALEALVAKIGVGDVAVLSGTGGAEMAVVSDIWKASRGEIDVAQVVRNHGFHGPMEGELSSRVWREDDSPLRKMVEQYSTRDDSDDPALREAGHEGERRAMEREVLAAVPRLRRPAVRVLLKLARERIPLRGVAKRSFLQAIDVARASARRAGEHLVADGVLANRDDVFYLTGEELTGTRPADAKDLVERRRGRREAYSKIAFATPEWAGMPEPVPLESSDDAGSDDVITGTGVSPGVVEGTVRVVTNPDFSEVEPDEILVAPTTDPSWSSIMFISSALVVDIGGALSHAAVVARELQIPCVVNTQTGTRALRTGDRVRVDGAAGTVEVLQRASA